MGWGWVEVGLGVAVDVGGESGGGSAIVPMVFKFLRENCWLAILCILNNVE